MIELEPNRYEGQGLEYGSNDGEVKCLLTRVCLLRNEDEEDSSPQETMIVTGLHFRYGWQLPYLPQ
jgi:hypothetical protein